MISSNNSKKLCEKWSPCRYD